MRGVWRSTVTAAIVALLAGGSAALPSPALAMTPVVRMTCDRIAVTLSTYSPYDLNAVVVTVDSVVRLSTNFGDSFVGSVALPDATTAHRWRVQVTTSGDPDGSRGGTRAFTGTSTPCEAGRVPPPSRLVEGPCTTSVGLVATPGAVVTPAGTPAPVVTPAGSAAPSGSPTAHPRPHATGATATSSPSPSAVSSGPTSPAIRPPAASSVRPTRPTARPSALYSPPMTPAATPGVSERPSSAPSVAGRGTPRGGPLASTGATGVLLLLVVGLAALSAGLLLRLRTQPRHSSAGPCDCMA